MVEQVKIKLTAQASDAHTKQLKGGGGGGGETKHVVSKRKNF